MSRFSIRLYFLYVWRDIICFRSNSEGDMDIFYWHGDIIVDPVLRFSPRGSRCQISMPRNCADDMVLQTGYGNACVSLLGGTVTNSAVVPAQADSAIFFYRLRNLEDQSSIVRNKPFSRWGSLKISLLWILNYTIDFLKIKKEIPKNILRVLFDLF